MHFSASATVNDTVSYKNYPVMMKVTCVTCAEKMRINNTRERQSTSSRIKICISGFLFFEDPLLTFVKAIINAVVRGSPDNFGMKTSRSKGITDYLLLLSLALLGLLFFIDPTGQ